MKNFTSRQNSKVNNASNNLKMAPLNPLELKLNVSGSNSADSRDGKTDQIRGSVYSKEDMSKHVNFSIENRSNEAKESKMMARLNTLRKRNKH